MNRHSRALLLIVLISSTIAQVACTTPVVPEGHMGTAGLLETYGKLPDARAIALAGDPDLTWVAGVVGGSRTRAEAESKALEECKRRRFANRMEMPCLPYASGDEIVWPSQ